MRLAKPRATSAAPSTHHPAFALVLGLFEAIFEAPVVAGMWEKRPQERTTPIPLSRFGDKKAHTVMMCCRIMAAEYVARDAMDLTDLPESMLPDDAAAGSLDGLVDLEVSDVAFG